MGPTSTAVAQFALSLLLLHRLAPSSFGTFSFLLTMAQFSTGVSNALVCAPLAVAAAGREGGSRAGPEIPALFAANLVFSGFAFVAFWALGALLGGSALSSALFAGFGAVGLLRWFARANAYVEGAPLRTVASDVLYSVTLGVAVLSSGFGGIAREEQAYAALLVATVVAMAPFGGAFVARQWSALRGPNLANYVTVWRQHARWTLLGVVTTEATANAHVYLVTLLAGPAAYATLAASSLLIRPLSVIINALTEFERPRLARDLHAGEREAARTTLASFRLSLVVAWLLSAALALAVLRYAPTLLFSAQYSVAELSLGAALWMAVVAVRAWRAPESTLLQAAGHFRPLAYASVISCGVSVVGVVLALKLAAPVWSLAGVLLGEAVFMAWTLRQARLRCP
ncbi:hypothetical protein SLNSH_16450 [Alsobacter soli]|uniref:Teichoic acid transporter n=1 Tax=Alsobacter soli TaxID=2109933 RepID=A0A2T1HQD6_9HYPH|nr:hypothetical protein [Alsobacter soli]PSC03865.1 hypothetical protein SLNSH_16450 [Alsobacter soli]